MTHLLTFRLACAPDLDGLRRLHALPPELADFEVVEYALQKRRASVAPDRLPAQLQRIVAISCITQGPQGMALNTWAVPEMEEAAIIQQFFDAIQGAGTLAAWDDSDLPVLYQRALICACHAGHAPGAVPHFALAHVLAAGGTEAPDLGTFARQCDLPGDFSQAEGLDAVQRCEAEVMLCHLLLLRYQRLCGELNDEACVAAEKAFRASLRQSETPLRREFLAALPVI